MSLRVLQVVPSYYPAFVYGGPIFSIHYICNALARQGVEIEVATTNANGTDKLGVPTHEPVALAPNYRVHYYDDTIIGRFSWAFTRHLWRDIRDAQMVHLQDVFSTHAVWTLMLSAVAGRPVLISARGTFTPWGMAGKRPWLKKVWLAFLVRPFVRDTSRVAWHATSEGERDEILAQFPKACVYIVPNGIDCGEFDCIDRPSRVDYLERFFPCCRIAPHEAKILVGLGRLHAKKAFDVAIEAFRRIADEYPGAVLLIAGGDDGERATLERLIAQLNLESRVSLVSRLDGKEKTAFLKGADLFVFPSHSENFGMVAVEALAAGLPVVASTNTPWQVVETRGAGLWVPNTPEAFAEAISQLLSGDLEPRRAAARSLASRYDVTAVAARFRRIYGEMIYGR